MNARVLSIGETLWDLLPSGKRLGGAPANFACHARALGAEAFLVSRVGNDPLGREILERLSALGLSTDGVAVDATAPTGTVTVELSADGQPHFTIHENVAWDYIVADDAAGAFSEQADLVCFGTLAQRSPASRAAIQSLVSRTPEKALRVCDINLRQQFYSKDVLESSLALANVLKLNDQELLALASMFELRGDSREQLATLAQRFNLKVVALTRGAAGSLLLMDGHWSEHPGIRAKVKDTIGAGDAFSAALTLGLLAGRPLNAISAQANKLAAYVCTQPGATPLVGRQKSVVPDL